MLLHNAVASAVHVPRSEGGADTPMLDVPYVDTTCAPRIITPCRIFNEHVKLLLYTNVGALY